MFILGSGTKCPGSNVHFGVGDQISGDQMSRDQMSIWGSGIKYLWIKCPFWSRGSNVRGSNVHFWVGGQKSGDQMSIFGSGIKRPWDQMSSGSNVHPWLWDRKSEIKSLGIRILGIKCPSPARTVNNF